MEKAKKSRKSFFLLSVEQLACLLYLTHLVSNQYTAFRNADVVEESFSVCKASEDAFDVAVTLLNTHIDDFTALFRE